MFVIRYVSLILVAFIFCTKIASAQILINEFSPQTDPEWVELYNSSSIDYDLNGWLIKDGNTKTSDDLSLTGTISAKATLVFTSPKGWLNDTGQETISLIDKTSVIIDSYTYESPVINTSYCRIPNGGVWSTSCTPTINSSNEISPSPAESPLLSLSPTPSPSIQSSPSPTPQYASSPNSSPQKTPLASLESPIPQVIDFQVSIGTVAGTTVSDAKPSTQAISVKENTSYSKTYVFLGLGLIFLSLAPSLYLWRSKLTQV